MDTKRNADAALRYAGVERREGMSHYGLNDTVAARDEEQFSGGG